MLPGKPGFCSCFVASFSPTYSIPAARAGEKLVNSEQAQHLAKSSQCTSAGQAIFI